MPCCFPFKRLFFAAICLHCFLSANAQAPEQRQPPSQEELRQMKTQAQEGLKKATTDTARVHLKMQLANLTARDNFTEALQLAEEALALAEKTNHPETLARAYFGMGNLFLGANRYDNALEYLNKGLPLAEKIGNTNLLEAYYNFLGRIYFNRGVFEKSLAYYQKSLQALEKMQAPGFRKSGVLNQIGMLLHRTGKHRDAIEILRKAAVFAEQAQNWQMAGGIWGNIANCYESLGEGGSAEEAHAKAAEYRERSKKKATSPAMIRPGNN